ncbi:MAG: hypothetical protein AAFV53_00620 [Myxococcota bacterium]
MSAIDEIIARSRTPGTFIERRHFTLSREKAIEKLREFSLRTPRQYILELIQAAVFSGATYIAVDINHERLLVAWVGGQSYRADELESIFDYLFADRGEMSTRHLTQLAIGLNALLQRKPKLIRIESGDGSAMKTARMDLDKAGQGSLGIPESGLAGTYILVEYPTSWLPRFTRRQFHPEEGLIEMKCLYVPVPVLLNGRAPFGYRASREIHLYGIRHQQTFDFDGRRGVIGLPGHEMGRAGRVGREFRMVVGGVWISSLELAELGGPTHTDGSYGPLSGVICDDRLRKTADQSDVVQDRRFVEMLHAVQPIATELVRDQSKRPYTPPSLPRIPDAPEEAEEQPAEPLPERIFQLGPRPALELDALLALPEGEPVFWVSPEAVEDLLEATDPQRFGSLVLNLTPGQVRSLELSAPDLGIARLNTPADADFVRRVIERRQMTKRVSLPFFSSDHPDVRGQITIRFHSAGPMPRCGDPRLGGTPLFITDGEGTLWCSQEPLHLSRVSITLELEHPVDSPRDLKNALILQAMPEVWRLLVSEQVDGDAPPELDAEQAFLSSIMALNTHAYFVAENGQKRLDATLPLSWGDHTEAFRSRGLCDALDGSVTLDGLIEMQGTGTVRTLVRLEDRMRMERIEERLGFGHLALQDADERPIISVKRIRGEWKVISRQADEIVKGPMVWLRPSIDPDWSPEISLHPTIGRSAPADVVMSPADWATGESILAEALREHDAAVSWRSLADGSGHSPRRCRGMARLALVALAVAGRTSGRILRTADHRPIAPSALAAGTDLRIAPAHGPAVTEPDTVLMTFDQLCIIEQHGVQTRLRFDDAPDVWRSLADASDPRWLIRQELRAPGIRGWLGLRDPFDGSSGVFVQAIGAVAALPDVTGQAPCHGLLQVSGRTAQLNRAQLELLTLTRKQLYQKLSDRLDRFVQDQRGAAEQYLAAYAAERAPKSTAPGPVRPLQHLRARLVDTLPPALNEGLFLSVGDDPNANGKVPLRLVNDEVRGGVLFMMDGKHRLTKKAMENPRGPASELLLLEMVRRLAVWADQVGVNLDLLEMQRVLIAQRVSHTAGEGIQPPTPTPTPVRIPEG